MENNFWKIENLQPVSVSEEGDVITIEIDGEIKSHFESIGIRDPTLTAVSKEGGFEVSLTGNFTDPSVLSMIEQTFNELDEAAIITPDKKTAYLFDGIEEDI